LRISLVLNARNKKASAIKQRLLKNRGGALKSLYELCFLNSYMVDIAKLNASPRYLEESFLKREYVEKGLSLRKLSIKFNCSKSVIRARLMKVGIRHFT